MALSTKLLPLLDPTTVEQPGGQKSTSHPEQTVFPERSDVARRSRIRSDRPYGVSIAQTYPTVKGERAAVPPTDLVYEEGGDEY